jgi:hypothetical protein
LLPLRDSFHARARNPVAFIDVLAVAVLAAPLIAVGVPAFGYLVAGAGWIGTRALGAADRRLLARIQSPTQRLGYGFFEAFGRIWLLVGAIIVAGVVGGRRDGLTAALTIFGAYSISLMVRLMSGPPPSRLQS